MRMVEGNDFPDKIVSGLESCIKAGGLFAL
jgi:hypothetical protein